MYDLIVEEYVEAFFDDFSDKLEIDNFLSSIPRSGLILDIGCGPGQFSKYCMEKGFRVIGIDFSSNMINKATKMVPNGIFCVMDMRNLGFELIKFDGLLVAYSFLHIEERSIVPALKGFYSVLKPDSVMSIMLKEGEGEVSLQSALNETVFFNTRLWKIDDITKYLNKAGFDVISCRRVFPSNEKEFQFNRLLILAKKP